MLVEITLDTTVLNTVNFVKFFTLSQAHQKSYEEEQLDGKEKSYILI